VKSITLAGLLCLPCALRLPAQAPPTQQPATPATPAPTGQPPVPPPPKPQPLQTNAPVDTTPEDDPDHLTYSVQPFYWISKGNFNLKSANQTYQDQFTGIYYTTPGTSFLPTLGDANKHTPGLEITFPAGKYNRLDITVFQTQGNGNSVAPQNLTFNSINIPAGDYISSSFRIRMAKVTWNYLTWPDPPETAKFRIRTMWGFQYTGVQTVIDAPYDYTLSSTPVFTHSIYYPSFGIGGEFVPSRHFYFEGQASGFAFPHRSVVWDAELKAVVRFWHVEIFAGDKAYHLKTSPKAEEYIVGTLSGPYAGIRLFVR